MRIDRRTKRSNVTTEALRLQLAACRSGSSLRGMVVSDQDGVVLASSGDEYACAEIAARLPLIGSRVAEFDGVLLSAQAGVPVKMSRISIDESDLYVCAIGGEANDRATGLSRSLGGTSRILAA